jgi:DegV family protein with EDD domain
MPPVAVVTDTCHYLPPELLAAHDIHQVSLYVQLDGRAQRESELRDWDAYYTRLADLARLPTTSQPSIGDFLAVYEPLLDAGRDVVSVHLAGGMSGTCESARQARAALGSRGERVHVVDSATACAGEGLVVLAAGAAAARGADAAETVAAVDRARRGLKLWFALETLEYLRRGGRIAGAQAWLGSALRIKPILSVESEITPVERVRTSSRAFERLVELLEECRADGADGWVVQHIQAPERAARLAERGREVLGTEPVFVGEIGPVIGTHVGPGLLGCGGVPAGCLR